MDIIVTVDDSDISAISLNGLSCWRWRGSWWRNQSWRDGCGFRFSGVYISENASDDRRNDGCCGSDQHRF